ncbi:hypothetical protein [Novosphingobium resinovorum]|uniref:hypothetical protein n=1 Tax=Novosphingobium resinovorum TaxID=158500 RepID=UPI002ED08429|nr:hypothetical protein [Novosphingobium resinovorum]
MKITSKLGLSAVAFVSLAASAPSMAHPVHADAELPDSYAISTSQIAFYNTPNRKHVLIAKGNPITLGKVTVDLKKSSNVMVQFTSGLATVVPEGCPCSVRVSLQLDGMDPIVIKRVNLGTARTMIGDKYQVDRQSADGSFVFPLNAGHHEIALVVQRIEGESNELHAFYPNMQALVFPATAPN